VRGQYSVLIFIFCCRTICSEVGVLAYKIILEVWFDSISCEDGFLHYRTEGVYFQLFVISQSFHEDPVDYDVASNLFFITCIFHL
jgi:hypothetical protein